MKSGTLWVASWKQVGPRNGPGDVQFCNFDTTLPIWGATLAPAASAPATAGPAADGLAASTLPEQLGNGNWSTVRLAAQ